MDSIFPLLYLILPIIVAYHIATRQGVFNKHSVLVTLSQPTLTKNGDKVPAYVKVNKIGNLRFPGSYPNFFYPYLLKMPLMVTFGTTEIYKKNVFFLLMTIINQTGKPVPDVTINYYLPDNLMPDNLALMGAPEGVMVKRKINKITRQGEIELNFSLKPYDNFLIPEPIFFDSSNIIKEIQSSKTDNLIDRNVYPIRVTIRTSDIIHEECFNVAAIEANSIDFLLKQSKQIGESLIDEYLEKLKKPFFHNLFKLPYGNRVLLCVKPGFSFPAENVAEQTFGHVDDRTESIIVGLVKK